MQAAAAENFKLCVDAYHHLSDALNYQVEDARDEGSWRCVTSISQNPAYIWCLHYRAVIARYRLQYLDLLLHIPLCNYRAIEMEIAYGMWGYRAALSISSGDVATIRNLVLWSCRYLPMDVRFLIQKNFFLSLLRDWILMFSIIKFRPWWVGDEAWLKPVKDQLLLFQLYYVAPPFMVAPRFYMKGCANSLLLRLSTFVCCVSTSPGYGSGEEICFYLALDVGD
ncbi:hypothetical protein KSP40_PGU001383 [Platanthera guangdongensis]|uniref:Uncharacterized protein n=1 Tax=Platanthera guangdongensis TaxID=2320717 RepID=A0ABR2M550_9ASPA